MTWKARSWTGPTLIVLLCIITALIWFYVRVGTATFDSYADATNSLGQITGLIGTVLFALTFVLSIRSEITEEAFGGMDAMYRAHKVTGATAFVLLMFHPLLLVFKFIPNNVAQAALYLIPGVNWAYNFGMISLAAMTLLIVLTLYVNLKYTTWKISHKFMGLVFAVACYHIFFVTSDITFYPVLSIYMMIICAIGLISYIAVSIFGPFLRKSLSYKLHSVTTTGNLTLLEMAPLGEHINFIPGQFAMLKIKDPAVSEEQHPFTIASAPEASRLLFGIKNLGDYTKKIAHLQKGALAFVEGPYGRFHSTKFDHKQIWIAGGIGITPFHSLTQHLLITRKPCKDITFFYCVKTENEFAFIETFKQAQSQIKQFTIVPWVSEKVGPLTAVAMQKHCDVFAADIFICGPPGMIRSLIKQLRDAGVSRGKIHIEDFGFR